MAAALSKRQIFTTTLVMIGVGAVLAVQPLAVGFAAGFILLGWLAVTSPSSLVVLLLLWLPIEGWALKFLPFGSFLLVVPDVISGMLLFVLVSRALSGSLSFDERERLRVLSWPVVALIVVAAASWMFWRPPVVDALYWVRVYFRFVPVALLMMLRGVRERVLAALPTVAVLTVVSQALVGLAQYAGGRPIAQFFWPGQQFVLGAVHSQADTLVTAPEHVVAGTLGHYNNFGMLLVLWIAVLFGHASATESGSRVLRRRISIAAAAAGSSAVLLSGSRQSIAMLAVLLMVWVARERGIGRKIRVAGGISSILALLWVFLGASAGLGRTLGRFKQLTDVFFWTNEVSMNRGYVATAVAWAALRESPVLGLGPGSLGSSYGSALGPIGVTALGLSPIAAEFIGDVGWVAVLSQVGLAGLACLGWLLIRVWRGVRQSGQDAVVFYGAVGALIVLVIGMFASTPLTYKAPSIAMWVMFGLAIYNSCGSHELARNRRGRVLSKAGAREGAWKP